MSVVAEKPVPRRIPLGATIASVLLYLYFPLDLGNANPEDW